MVNDAFNLRNALLCDDIRREDNGKAILIGVYSGDIVVPQAPVVLGLSLWLEGTAVEGAQTVSIRTRVVQTNDEEKEADSKDMGSMTLNIEPSNDFIIALGRIPVEIQAPGKLYLLLKYGARDWVEVLSKRIQVTSAASSIAQKPQA